MSNTSLAKVLLKLCVHVKDIIAEKKIFVNALFIDFLLIFYGFSWVFYVFYGIVSAIYLSYVEFSGFREHAASLESIQTLAEFRLFFLAEPLQNLTIFIAVPCVSPELNISAKTLDSVNEASDDVLLVELLRRGYDVARLLQKNESEPPFESEIEKTTSKFV